ncbi:MAG TPA: hypothetical protein VMF06_06920 [Candidatus Limnocylindria bacterium]|jgi:hypothetical protein|nr:hypothetical protein [Candidatus Limnocylindria bacterium]
MPESTAIAEMVQNGFLRAGEARRGQQQLDLLKAQGDRQAKLDEIQQRLGEQKVADLRSEFLAQDQLRKADMVNFAEANGAFDTYTQAAREIGPGDPDRVQRLTSLKLQYMPSIAKHPAVAQKFDALDKTDRQSDAWVSHSILMQQLAGLQQEALRYNLGPEAIGLMEGVRKGSMSTQDAVGQLSSAIAVRRDEETQKERDFEIARAGTSARIRTDALSDRDEAYGRWSPNNRTPRSALDDVAKEKLSSLRDQLTGIAKTELDLHMKKPNPNDAAGMEQWRASFEHLRAMKEAIEQQMDAVGKRPPAGVSNGDMQGSVSNRVAQPDPVRIAQIVNDFHSGQISRNEATNELNKHGIR